MVKVPKKRHDFPTTIIRVTNDHQTLYARLPAAFIERNKLKRGDYLVIRDHGKQLITLSTLQSELKDAQNLRPDKTKGR